MTTTLSYLDSYCERAGNATLLAEPLNLITNIFFIAGALVAFYAIFRLPPEPVRKRLDLWGLAVLLFAIGIGSGLWHAIPSRFTVLMDVIPITLFIHLYLISAMRRFLQLKPWHIAMWWLLYVILTVAAQLTLSPDLLNGTIMYIPTYIALIFLAVAVSLRSKYLAKIFFCMVALWTVSLVFRTVDPAVCKTIPMGTHFLWHSLNAFMLYRLLLTIIRYRPPVVIPIVA